MWLIGLWPRNAGNLFISVTRSKLAKRRATDVTRKRWFGFGFLGLVLIYPKSIASIVALILFVCAFA
jgi:hypothetical protein